MSHFTVMVIGDDVEGQLQPYHEYECTGTMDEYVIEIDETAEHVDEYQTGTVELVQRADGTRASRYDDEFYVPETTDSPFPRKKFQLPPGASLITVPFTEHYSDFETWLDQYHGRSLDGGRVIRHTNPNAKWDWWVVGGRWSGFLKVKPGVPRELGRPGVFGRDPTIDSDLTRADSALKGELDIQGMRDDAAAEANKKYDEFERVTAGLDVPPRWQDLRQEVEAGGGTIDEAREKYAGYLWVQALRAAHLDPWAEDARDYYFVGAGGREAFVQDARDGALQTYAVVKDGQWFSKGEMGWFGMSNDTLSDAEWRVKLTALIDELSDDTQITIVDCHI